MSLFQKSVEKKYLNELSPALIDSKYSAFIEYFGNRHIQQNIKSAKEEQFQEGFLRELFVKILGYTLQPEPDYNLISEFKNITNSRKADGAILRGEEAVAVIELKSLSTNDLDTIESQAFGYKNHHPKCIYVITSNFGKLRFYIQNAVDYIDFDLFNLSRQQFCLLWLCLAKDNLLSDVPLKIKESSLLQEENITKKLYADYSKFRNTIYNNLVKNNPELDKLLLFRKTQKLLDRFLFVFFAEDRLLLPPNSISEIVRQWTSLKDELDEYIPLYARFKKFFGYLNTGYKGKKYDIYPYNGGLFAPDEVLDNVLIDDTILYEHTARLSTYDFDTEVDVNILGHIFEHSLGEIENLEAEIKGEKVETQKSKRKKDGIYYTPKYITKYIVENTVGKLCLEKRAEFGIIAEDYAIERSNKDKAQIIALDEKLTAYRNWLLTITILDPACGSGAFLNQALEFLIEEHRKIDELRALLFGGGLVFADITNDILENNILGVDINEESVEIAKLSLWLRTAQKGRKLNTLTNNIKCGNSLIDDPEIAGDKAFDWEKEFPDIMSSGGFDVVIGNPPYVSKTFDDNNKIFFKRNYKTAEYQLELYVLFMELGVKLLNKKRGRVSYILPNSWMKNLMFIQCRKFLLSNLFFEIIIPNLNNVFSDASVDTCIFIASNQFSGNFIRIEELNQKEQFVKHEIDQSRLLKNEKYIFDIEISDNLESIFTKIDDLSIKLEDISDITRGINPYDKYQGQSEEIIRTKAYHSYYKKDDSFVPELRGKHINRYSYIWDEVSFVSYGEWLAAPREMKYFEGERILCRQVLSNHLNCCLISEKFIIDQSIFIAKVKEKFSLLYSGKYLVSILASKLIIYYFRLKANEFDDLFPKIKIGEFRILPIPDITTEAQLPFIELADIMLEKNKELQEIKNKFMDLLKADYGIEKLNTKLQNWYEISWADFTSELKKLKIELKGEMKEDWSERFNRMKAKATEIKNLIDTTDRKIDSLVYELYGLTEEEIKIVEGE